MVEEAIRNGTWIPPSNNRIRIDPSKKPQLFEAYLATSPEYVNGKLKQVVWDEHPEWDGIMPFSAAYATQQGLIQSPTSPTQSTTELQTTFTTFIPAPIRSRWLRTFGRVPPATNPSSSIPTTSIPGTPLVASLPGSQQLQSTAPSSVRVAVLIAMPSKTPLSTVIQKNHGQHVEEDDLPHLEFGVTDVVVQDVVVQDARHETETEQKGNETRKTSIGSSVEM